MTAHCDNYDFYVFVHVAGGEQCETGRSGSTLQIWSKHWRPDKCLKTGRQWGEFVLLLFIRVAFRELVYISGTFYQDMIAVSHSQAPQKPVRRKYHPESQNLETGPPPAMPFPSQTKHTQKLVSHSAKLFLMGCHVKFGECHFWVSQNTQFMVCICLVFC